MEVLYPRCAGLDVHKDTVVACVRCVSQPAHHEVRSFAPRRAACSRWPTGSRRTAARTWRWRPPASTGSRSGTCWKARFELVLANAQHIRNVPGSQDRRERRDVDCRSAGARADPQQLRAARSRSRSCAT